MINYCGLDESSYKEGDDVNIDECLHTIDKELGNLRKRIEEESEEKYMKMLVDLEDERKEKEETL